MCARRSSYPELRVIPADFLNTVLSVKTNEQLIKLKCRFLKIFGTTLSDDLNPMPINCNPMFIKLQPDAIPVCVTTARRVPKHFEPESKKTIEELIESRIIPPVNEPTTSCSPAFLVPKSDGKRVRLVTDFTAPNKFVQWPTHPFSSTREIIEAIPPDAKFFCKLDAVHGYFQLALDERSNKLTTLLIQQGQCRCTCEPPWA